MQSLTLPIIEPERRRRVAPDGAPHLARRRHSRDKRFAPSTKWGCPATGPAAGAEAIAWPEQHKGTVAALKVT
jgi:hypothetical protein